MAPSFDLNWLRVCVQDNYSWLVHEPVHNLTAVVDPAEVPPILRALEAK